MAAGTSSTGYTTTTVAAAFIPELWSMIALVDREANLVMAKRVDRRWEAGLSYGDTIHIPPVTNLAAASTKTASTIVSYETMTETNVDINIATHQYKAMHVESIARIQANRDLLKLYAGKMGFALALAVDDVLAGLIDDFTNTVGTLGVENTDDDFIRARQYLNDANANQDDRTILISPAAEAGMLKLDRFVHADYGAVHSGEGTREQQSYSGAFYRTPVYVSTNTEGGNTAGHDNAMFHRSAIALVMQLNPTAHAQYDIDFLTDKVVIEQIYGYREMRDDHGVWMRGA